MRLIKISSITALWAGLFTVVFFGIRAIVEAKFLLHPLGVCTGNAVVITQCRGYNFWSGIGSDLQEITLLTGIGLLYWHHTCHVGLCFLPGRHPVEGTGFKTCRRHHPDINHGGRTTADHIHKAFHEARSHRDPRYAALQHTARDNAAKKKGIQGG